MEQYIVVSTDTFEVSNVQAYKALAHFGILTPLREFLNTLPEDHLYRLAFEKAPTFKNDSPVLLQVANELGLTKSQVTEIFAYAKTVIV